MDQLAIGLVEIAYAIASLALISAGLALVFGMMRVINLAHGEFIVLGGYATIVATGQGVNVWVAMLIVAPLTVGVIGLIVERLIIRWLYGRLIDSMLATWGLSLLLVGLITTIFGNTVTGVSNPIGPVSIGEYQVGGYSLFIIGITVALLLAIYGILKFTRWGLIARGAMQSAEVLSALGYSPSRVYMITFALGAAVSGLAGGVLAPLTGLVPTSGGQFIAKAFITVIAGGSSVIAGTTIGSALFGTVSKVIEMLSTTVGGEIALLVVAVVLLRVLPTGITGRFFRNSV
jgi:branched-chain amino acid transport system permease protein